MKNTEQRLIDSALSLFSEYGYSAVTTKQIAAKAKTSEVTLYRHFESKKSLFIAVIHRKNKHKDLYTKLDDCITYDVEKDIRLISAALLEFYTDNALIMQMLFKANMKDDKENFVDHHNRMEWEWLHVYFEKMCEMGKIADDPEKVCLFFITNLKGFFFRNYIFKRNKKIEEDFDWLIGKVIQAINIKV